MAEFCHPEFGCDCVQLSRIELRALLGAAQQVEDEFGFEVRPDDFPRVDESLESWRKAKLEAADNGRALIERLRAAVS
jgi:hypothetical protein